jgi:hypothetical protein
MVASGGQMRTLRDLTVPVGFPGSVRISGPVFNPYGVRVAEDKLMSNVLSFEVKFTGTAGAASGLFDQSGNAMWPRPYADPSTGAIQNTDYPYDTLPYDGKFDTFTQYVPNWNNANSNAAPLNQSGSMKPIRITGVMIRLRSFDARTRSTRQTTLIQDL